MRYQSRLRSQPVSFPEISRRDFVKATVASTGAAALSAVAAGRVWGANERVQMGVIGVGGMGTRHVGSLVKRADADNVRVAAVCDVYQRRVTRAQNIAKAEGCLDYRKILDRSDIDAVLIATPDHWHAKIAIEAMEAGKHVYVEKPMT